MAVTFTVKKPIVVPQTAGQPQNPAMPLPRWALQPDPGQGPPPSVGEDISNVGPRALRTGMELAVPPVGAAEGSKLMPMIARAVLEQLNSMGLVRGGDETLKEFDQGYSSFMEGNPIDATGLAAFRESVTDPLLGKGVDKRAQTFPGKVAQTALEVGPSVALGPGTALQKLGITGGSAVGAEGLEAGADALNLSPGWQDAAHIIGSLGGGLSPSIYNRLANPRPIPASRQGAVNTLRTRNVPMSAGQMTGNKRLMFKEEMAGGTAAHEAQPAALTRAAADIQSGFPAGTDVLTRPTMRAELDRMGAEFDRLTAGAEVPFTPQLQDDLLDATVNYTRDNPMVAPVVEDMMNDLATNAAQNGGLLTGRGYSTARTKINERIRNQNTDPGVREALIDMQDALDEAVAHSLSAEDQAAFRRVRAQYRNFLPIEHAKAGPGQATAEGYISGPGLKAGIKATQGKREVAAGETPLMDLAESANTVLEKMPNSGTAQRGRAALAGLMPLFSAAVAGGGGLASSLGPTAAAILAGGTGIGAAAIPAIRDAWITSRPGQAFLGRQGPRIPTDRAGLAAMLAAVRTAAAREHGDQERR